MIEQSKAQKWAARNARLSTALRENLKRRKAQIRGRADSESQRSDSPDGDSLAHDGIGTNKPPDFRRNPGRKSPIGSSK
jgi:hypothetical protein